MREPSAAFIKETICSADNRAGQDCRAVIRTVGFVQHESKPKALDPVCHFM